MPLPLPRFALALAATTLLPDLPRAQVQMLRESRREHLPTGLGSSGPQTVTAADVDGDGLPDAVFSDGATLGSPAATRLFVQAGERRFLDATRLLPPVPAQLARIIAGDVDADGDADLVLLERAPSPTQPRLLVNQGRGVFADATATQMPVATALAQSATLVDIDRDGDRDLYLACGGQDQLWRNDGAGRFTDATAGRVPVSQDQHGGVAAGDLDGDGDLDLLIAAGCHSNGCGQLPSRWKAYANDGQGVLTDASASSLPVQPGWAFDCALGDVDGDGDLDAVATAHASSPPSAALLLNDGRGVLRLAPAGRFPVAPAGRIALVDLDRDGDLDTVAASGTVLENDGTGAFTDRSAQRMPAHATGEVAVADIDLDGDPDLLMASGGYPRLLLNDGLGWFTDLAERAIEKSLWLFAGAAGDLDADGDPDLLVAGFGSAGVSVLHNRGGGAFTTVTQAQSPGTVFLPFTRYPRGARLIDVDGDRDLDAVIAVQLFGTGPRPMNDLLLLNDGAGAFADATVARFPNQAQQSLGVAAGDVDGDGDADLVFAGPVTTLLVNDGTGTFQDASRTRLPPPGASPTSVALADLDGDGDLDLLDGTSGQDRMLRNDGAGGFSHATASLPPLGSFTNAVVAIDLDRDSDLDLVTAESGAPDGRQVRVLLNDGTGAFADMTATNAPVIAGDVAELATADLDQDGLLDVVAGLGSATPGRRLTGLAFLGNGGNGQLADITARWAQGPLAVAFESLVLADLDLDGDQDLVSLGSASALWQNLVAQMHAPYAAILGGLYRLDFDSRLGAAFGLALLSPRAQSPRVWLPGLGLLGIDPNGAVALPAVPLSSQGMGSLELRIPAAAGLAGNAIYVQGFVGLGPAPPVLSGVVGEVVLR